MRIALGKLVVSLLFLPCAYGLEDSDLLGTWDVVSEGLVEEGISARDESRSEYFDNGKFQSTGAGFLVLGEEKARIMAIAAVESGNWKVKDGKLHVKTDSMEMDFFSSRLEEMTREHWDENIPELLKVVDVYEVVSVSKESIVLKDEEDGMITKMTRVPGADGKVVVGQKVADPTANEKVVADPLGQRYRRFSMALLKHDGFKAANSLPTWKNRKGVSQNLRPKEEILDRLLCNYAAISWVVIPEESLASKQIRDFVERNDLGEKLTDGEKKILATKREDAAEEFMDSVGWQMENMWALAWVLGYAETPDIDQDQIGEATISSIWKFLVPAGEGKAAFLKSLEMRPLNELVQLEDIFYCAHNSVRSAITGKDTVPENFHPARDGGIIHEKRHALTWVLSPGVAWEDTDLST